MDSFPRPGYGLPGACPGPKKQTGPVVGHGLPLGADSRTGSRLSGRGRGAEPGCGPGCARSRHRPQRSNYRAQPTAQRFHAAPVGSAPSASSAQAAVPARRHELPVASAVSGRAISGLKSASAHPACFQLVSAVTVTYPDPAVTHPDPALTHPNPDPAVANPDPSFTHVVAETEPLRAWLTAFPRPGRRRQREPAGYRGVPASLSR